MSDGDPCPASISDNTYALSPSPVMVAALGNVDRPKPTKGQILYGITGSPNSWVINTVSVSKSRKPDMSAPRECFSTWHDCEEKRGWCSQLWLFNERSGAVSALSALQEACKPLVIA